MLPGNSPAAELPKQTRARPLCQNNSAHPLSLSCPFCVLFSQLRGDGGWPLKFLLFYPLIPFSKSHTIGSGRQHTNTHTRAHNSLEFIFLLSHKRSRKEAKHKISTSIGFNLFFGYHTQTRGSNLERLWPAVFCEMKNLHKHTSHSFSSTVTARLAHSPAIATHTIILRF